MTASIPPAPTLSFVSGDRINYGGKSYTISSAAAGSDNGNGKVTYVLTLTGAPVSTITVSADNCVLHFSDGSSTGTRHWRQSATL